jgi:urea transporter
LASTEPLLGKSQANAPSFGYFSLALLNRGAGGPSDALIAAVVVAGVLVAIGLLLVVIRRAGTAKRPRE